MLSLETIDTTVNTYQTFATCLGQLAAESVDPTPWYQNYRLFSSSEDSGEHPIVGANANEITIVGETFTVIGLLNNGWGAFKKLKSGYYYFPAGKSAGKFLGTLITSIDKWGGLNWITPMEPWDYYSTQAGLV